MPHILDKKVAMTIPTPPIPLFFDPNSLYILLLDRGDTYLFHWELYLTLTSKEGITFHINNDTGPTKWQYKSARTAEMPQLRRLLLALKIGVLEPILHKALADRLALVPLSLYSNRFREQLSCRVWVKEALFALDDEGYVNLGRSVRDIDEEARYLGMLIKSKSERRVVRSKACMA